LIRVHAASLNTADTQKAAGMMRIVETVSFPLQIGGELSGSIVAVGSAVTKFKPGDDVFCCYFKPGVGAYRLYA
jgi:NADPH:quinone reductase-like Zn-dependent oxidoreductase